MTDEEVTKWIRLVKDHGHGVTIKRLTVAGLISGSAQAAAAGSRDRAAAETQGKCQVELWKLPRPTDENGAPEAIAEATHEQAERFVNERAAADQRNV